MRTIYREGRCTQCGLRVTLERAALTHPGVDGRPCGPVETHRPFDAPYGAPDGPFVAA